MIKERLQSAAFGAGWSLVCKLPESWARKLFNLGADFAPARCLIFTTYGQARDKPVGHPGECRVLVDARSNQIGQ